MSKVENDKTRVLSALQVEQKIKRIAFEIYENNFKEKAIVLAGIDGQGYLLAQWIGRELTQIAPLSIRVVKVSLDKLAPRQCEVTLDCEEKDFGKKCVIMIDDVLNTGKTLAFGMKPFLHVGIKKIEIAVLVNRSHPLFPIQPNYTGFELTTTLNDHVNVVLGKKAGVYLN